MKKTELLPLVISALCIFSCGGNREENASRGTQTPNILFICIDDLRPELGCYGNDHIHSPNIDRFAQSASIFTQHYTQVPICGASRFSMLTGMLPQSRRHLGNEVFRHFISFSEEGDSPETFIHHLRRNGYYTVGIGKISHSDDGFLYDDAGAAGVPELPHSWNEVLFDAGKWGTGQYINLAYINGKNRISMEGQVKPYEMADVDDLGYPDGLSARLAIQTLNQLAGKGQPFFLGVGFLKPHLPFNSPKKYWDFYNRDELALSPNPFIPLHVHPASLHSSGEFNGYQMGDEKASLNGPVSDAYAQTLRHAYFACISYIDAQVGKLIDELEALGIADNTVVVIWGDHGWHLGDHLVWGKHTLFERALKSALLIRVPGVTNGDIVTKVVSSSDIYPTIIDLCGLDMPHLTDGRSLLPIMRDPEAQWKEAAYGYFRNGVTLRTERYRLTKYFRNQQPVVELYDHSVDPYETRNIAQERPDIVEQLWPLWEIGNTGLYEE
jgi:arylsulfatase A-like enzyme